MTRIEDELTDAARRLRQDVDRSIDVDAALGRVGRPPADAPGRRRPALLLASAAVVVAVALVGVLAVVDRGAGRSVVAGGPSTTVGSRPPTAAAEDAGIPFDLLVQAPSSQRLRPGSMVYAGVADALRDHWPDPEIAGLMPTVDFDRHAVLILTTTYRPGCPEELDSLERNGTTVTPRFSPGPPGGACGAELLADTYYVRVLRADLPMRFTLVLEAAVDGSYPEQRLAVDLDSNFADSSPAQEDIGSARPDGADLQAPEPGRVISFEGVGPVRLDELLDPSEVRVFEGGGSCGYWGPMEPSHDGDEPLGGLVSGADAATPRVLDIVISRNSRYRTASGVGIGTTLATLRRVYGDDLVVDRADGWERPTEGLLASYVDVAAVRNGDNALTFYLQDDVVSGVKISRADFWGDDEGCA